MMQKGLFFTDTSKKGKIPFLWLTYGLGTLI